LLTTRPVKRLSWLSLANEFGYEIPVKNPQGEVIGTVQQNAKIVDCSYIGHALALINTNPMGFVIS